MFKATYDGVHDVAIKIFNATGCNEEEASSLMNEISLLRTCRHSNIVQVQSNSAGYIVERGFGGSHCAGEGPTLGLSWNRVLERVPMVCVMYDSARCDFTRTACFRTPRGSRLAAFCPAVLYSPEFYHVDVSGSNVNRDVF